jgi:hypothetical protein
MRRDRVDGRPFLLRSLRLLFHVYGRGPVRRQAGLSLRSLIASSAPSRSSAIRTEVEQRRRQRSLRVARHPDRAGASSPGSLSDDALADSAISPSATSLPKCSPNASISGCLRKYVATQIRSLPGFRFAVTPTVPMKEPSSRWRTGMSPEIYPNGGASRAGT